MRERAIRPRGDARVGAERRAPADRCDLLGWDGARDRACLGRPQRAFPPARLFDAAASAGATPPDVARPCAQARRCFRGWEDCVSRISEWATSDDGTVHPVVCMSAPPPPSRTNWTRLVPPSVLTGHVLTGPPSRPPSFDGRALTLCCCASSHARHIRPPPSSPAGSPPRLAPRPAPSSPQSSRIASRPASRRRGPTRSP